MLDFDDLNRRMDGALDALKKEFAGLRTGRASASLLEPVQVDAYGAKMPLSQVASVAVADSRLLSVTVWDAGLAQATEKAIRESGLGLNPAAEGTVIRVPLPELSAERREELVKVAHKYAESARVAIRNVRRDGMDTLKKLEKDKEISEDDHQRMSKDVQAATDKHVGEVDKLLESKEGDIRQV